MPALALTLQVEAGEAEAMSEALLEAGAESVDIDHPGQPRATLQVLVTTASDAGRLIANAARAAGLAAVPAFTSGRLEDQDWVRRTQSEFSPIEIGERLWVGASWHEPPRERIAVRVAPGLAFGTGSHATTRLVLAFLERTIQGGERVLDYGCGSGILAIAAAKLGAASVDGTDIDPVAVETALANALANNVELGASPPDSLAAAPYDVVVSNILAQPLILLAPVLAARTARGGRVALAGILDFQAAEVANAYAPWYDVGIEAVCDGWALVTGLRR